MAKIVEIDVRDLKEITRLRCNSLMGKALKRIEILKEITITDDIDLEGVLSQVTQQQDELKRQLKELVFEEVREMTSLIVNFNTGYYTADQR
jgi:hypothetical protein